MHLLIRADATATSGAGHAMRMLALAQEWRRQASAVLWAGDIGIEWVRLGITLPPTPIQIASREWRSMRGKLSASPDGWIAFDSYEWGLKDQLDARGTGRKLLVVEDFVRLEEYQCDMVLNYNVYAPDLVYNAPGARLLLGLKYVPLRREILAAERRRRTRKRAKTVLVSLGGSNVAIDGIVGILEEAGYDVIFGGPGMAMVEALSSADMAVLAGGSTLYEAAYLGLPAVVLCIAQNQERNAVSMSEVGVVHYGGWLGDVSPNRLREMIGELAADKDERERLAAAGQALVDGRGAQRVVKAMLARGRNE